ncbi:ROK family protein [Paenibacillus nasutitermitis]|uniref:Serine/threonine protein kinase n=1 Tax=Paenibacillus nasutitermitis TaxID=1652958 RepID=A0A917E328_9BACL|nr:ROK family protein [Paenibacillus nasutitermitis]GGD95708.1 serine/threonine protein kinase [Paenibacillus nasutitermitis]
MSKGTGLLRQMNEKRALALLRSGEHHSRQELAKLLGLSKNTISLIIDSFIKQGIVVEKGLTEQAGAGRPRIRLELVPDFHTAIGLSIGHSSCQYIVTDYRSSILESGEYPILNTDAEPFIGEMIGLCGRLLAKYPRTIGIGATIPALVDPHRGIVHFSSHLNWKNTPLKEKLDKHLPVKTMVMNNVKASALAVASTMPGAGDSANLFYLRIDEGVGGAQIIDGRIYNGASFIAGEIGHLCVHRDGPLCACGQRGCLEALVSMPAVKEQIRSRYPQAELEGNPLPWIVSKQNEDDMRSLLRTSGEHVGFALSQLVNLVNPRHIMINSPLAELAPFKQAVQRTMEQRALHLPFAKTSLQFLQNAFSASIGAAYAVILDFEKE